MAYRKHKEMRFGIHRFYAVGKTLKFWVPKPSVIQDAFSFISKCHASEKPKYLKEEGPTPIFWGSASKGDRGPL